MTRDRGIGPAGYHRTYYGERDWRFYSGLLAEIVRFSEPGPILDVGAGCGLFIEAAVGWGIECVGLEGSAEAIGMAHARSADLDLQQHRLSEPFPFPEASFQTVVLNQVLEHLEPVVAVHALAEAYRVLRPRGLILVGSPSRFNRQEWRADPTHVNLVSPGELRALLVQAGFTRVRPFDTPLPLLGTSRLGRRIVSLLFRLWPYDRISATANAMAYRPG